MEITFDLTKDTSNTAKHGVSLAEAKGIDWDTVISLPDVRRDYGEPREIGYGLIGDYLYCVVFVQRGQTCYIISLRRANSKEVALYAKQA